MPAVVEIIIIGWFLYQLRRVWKTPARLLVRQLVVLAIALIISALLHAVIMQASDVFGSTTNRSALFWNAAAILAAIMAWTLVRRRGRPSNSPLDEPAQRHLLATGLKSILSALYLAVAVTLLMISGSLCALFPDPGHRGWISPRLAVTPTPPPDPTPEPEPIPVDPRTPSELQRALWKELTNRWNQGRTELARATGAQHIVDSLEAIRALTSMSPEACNWLCDRHPSFRNLLLNPRLQTLAQDDDITHLIDEAVSGSPGALMTLLDHPDITALTEDRDLVRQFKSIDLMVLKKDLESYQNSLGSN